MSKIGHSRGLCFRNWPVPGFEDTELGVLMEPEVRHGETEVYTRVQAYDLSVHQSRLRSWVKALADDRQHAFPDQGQMKPEQLEIAQLKREVIRLKAERDILKKAAAYFAKESM